jgi:hypothetical protein
MEGIGLDGPESGGAGVRMRRRSGEVIAAAEEAMLGLE